MTWGRRLLARWTTAVLFMGITLPVFGAPSESVGNSTLEVSIHLKVLAYDRSLPTREKRKLVVAILFKPGDTQSKDTANEMLALLGRGGLKVQDLPIEAVLLPYSPGSVADDLSRAGADAIYLGPSLEDAVTAIVGLATAKKLITLTGGLSTVKQGIAVGVYLRTNGRPGIAINLATARASGMMLAPSVLSLATVFE